MSFNIILMGVNHSGTSVVAEMFKQMGWNIPDTGKDYIRRNEIKWVQECNAKLLYKIREIEDYNVNDIQNTILENLIKMEEPWIIKSPQFVLTLEYWELSPDTVLIYLDRNLRRLEASFRKRGQLKNGKPGEYGCSVKRLRYLAHEQYKRWKYNKCRIDYNDIKKAIDVFDVKRIKKNNEKFGKSGWL